MIVAAIPIKPFGVAKARLAPVLEPAMRSSLGRSVAARTADLASAAGADVVIVTPDRGVAEWAKLVGHNVLREGAVGGGLDNAAATAARHATGIGMRWAIVLADLPIVSVDELRLVFEAATSGPVIVPSYNGGTNVLAAEGSGFPFAYGTGSFHRHLAAMPEARVVSTAGLALDLDSPRDLYLARQMPAGRWLDGVIGSPEGVPGGSRRERPRR